MRTLGTPAGTLQAASGNRYRKDRAGTGRRGELNTARYLDRLLPDENVWCYHDLWVPGGLGRRGETANIDHVLVTGRRVLVIDSKVWKPATYWTVGGTTRRGLKTAPWADSGGVGLAVDRLAERIPHALVTGLTLVWPSRPGRLNVTLHRQRGGIRTYPADTRQADSAIRRALGRPSPPDPTATALLATLLPSPHPTR